MRHQILFISSWFPSKIEPTNGNFVQRHAESVALLHDVEILHAIGDPTQKETYVFDEQVINGIKTLIVYYRNTKNPVINFFRRMKSYKMGFLRLKKPHLVHANVLHNSMYFAVYLKKKYKIPFVITEHWTALRKINEKKTSKNIKRNAKIIGNNASKILPVSKDLELGIKALGVKTSIKVIPNVVNTSIFYPNIKKNEVYTFIHVSNLVERKNPEKILSVAVNLFEKGHFFKLQIGGDGDISNLIEIANNSNFKDYIEIFGIMKTEEVAERLKRSDCFILFSDDENQPCVIAESFASGIQVISTNVGGISEFFPNFGGILLNKVEEDLLEKAMIKVMSSDLDNDSLKIVKYADQFFSVKAIGKQFSEVYNDILLSDV